jgi:hypothetical protein
MHIWPSTDRQTMSEPPPRYRTYGEFWPFYLAEHCRAGTRALHLCGTALALGCLAAALVAWDWRPLLAAPLVGYGFAWLGHAIIERNRPATFRYPLWSFISDFRMLGLWITGRLGDELTRHGIAGPERPSPPRA